MTSYPRHQSNIVPPFHPCEHHLSSLVTPRAHNDTQGSSQSRRANITARCPSTTSSSTCSRFVVPSSPQRPGANEALLWSAALRSQHVSDERPAASSGRPFTLTPPPRPVCYLDCARVRAPSAFPFQFLCPLRLASCVRHRSHTNTWKTCKVSVCNLPKQQFSSP
jgi:hypothetical protein